MLLALGCYSYIVPYKNYILSEGVWNSISDEKRFALFCKHYRAELSCEYGNAITEEQTDYFLTKILRRLSGTHYVSDCDIAADFMISCYNKLSEENKAKLLDALKNSEISTRAMEKLNKHLMI